MKIKVNDICNAMLEERVYRPHYLDPQTGSIHSSICLDQATLVPCNASDLDPKTGKVRDATFIDPASNSICKAAFGVNTLKAYEDAGFVKVNIPFCSQAYLCQTFLRSRFPNKQQREEICKQYGIDDSYDFKFIYSEDEYDKAMEARELAYIAAARNYFGYMPQDEGECNPDDIYATFEWYACFSYAILWGLENGYTLMGDGLLWNVYE